MTYTQKLTVLTPWFSDIIDDVKKDLKQDHIAKDREFLKKYLSNKPVQRLTSDELVEAYKRVIADDAENVAEFIVVRWLLKNTDLYQCFESELSKISPDFDKLESIDDGIGQGIIDRATKEFGAVSTYLFSLLNGVVFSEALFAQLHAQALQEQASTKAEAQVRQELATIEQLKTRYEADLQKLEDKYEKKLSGLQRKYIQDIDSYKKQISGLQRKLQAYVS